VSLSLVGGTDSDVNNELAESFGIRIDKRRVN